MSACFSLARNSNLSRSQPDSRLLSLTFPPMAQLLHPLYEHTQPIISLTKGSRSSETSASLSLHGENLTLISTRVIPSSRVSPPQQRNATASLETSFSISFLKNSCNVLNMNEKYNNRVSCFLSKERVFFCEITHRNHSKACKGRYTTHTTHAILQLLSLHRLLFHSSTRIKMNFALKYVLLKAQKR